LICSLWHHWLFCSSRSPLWFVWHIGDNTYMDPLILNKYVSINKNKTHLSLKRLDDCLNDISGWVSNSKLCLNVNKTDFLIIRTSSQRSNLTLLIPTNIFCDNITPSDAVCNLSVTFDSDFNFRIIFIWRVAPDYIIFVTVVVFGAIVIFLALITSRLDCCNSLLYKIASKDIQKRHCVENCLARVVSLLKYVH